MRVLVVENSPLAPIGHFGTWLERRHGAVLHTVAGPELPEGWTPEADLLVTLGSPKAAYDADAWIGRQRALLARWIVAERPAIGICFGAQMIASAIGGSVAPTGTFHEGWMETAEISGPVWRGPWIRWHGDHVALPPEAEVLARSEGTIQAFRHRRAVGVQFHPEANAGCIADWIGFTPPERLAAKGLQPEALLALTRERDARLAAQREALFTEMLALVGLGKKPRRAGHALAERSGGLPAEPPPSGP
ncbi:type 1 glutamine amidotransferase [Roseomonas sp. M0104]|uniref:Type 1 glutamine amidotransferase n=1 Tax=Teichococcus coralli TaxID=2545983 RepID=A0A845BFK3_9PROT|nr:type 1 glutamine amidotransferase [Pseudoroseomonas coralli]MXP64834.1 type 1 glutamine amidotransferase [Pseudoroseomonas coralli]